MLQARKLVVLPLVLAFLLAGCPAPAQTPAAQTQATAAPAATTAAQTSVTQPITTSQAATTTQVSSGDQQAQYDRILQCVQKNFPAERYMTNDYLPDPNAEWKPMQCDKVDKIKVGMPWVLNDEEVPWYNAIEKGYYKDVCLDVTMVPGGPGINQLQSLAGGALDIAVSAAGNQVPTLVASRTPADVVAVGTFLKHSPYIWLGLDNSIPKDQRSTLKITPQDFIGKKIGLQPGDDYFFDFLANKYNLPKDKITIMEAGFTPDPLLVGAMDYIAAWIVNQPRLLEEKGYMNWVAFQYSDWGLDDYSDVSAVRRDTLDKQPDLVKRYLAATYQGMKYMLDNPDDSATIAVKYGVDAQLTKDQVLRRLQLQKDLVIGSDNLPIMHMTPETWNSMLASKIQYKQLELAACQ